MNSLNTTQRTNVEAADDPLATLRFFPKKLWLIVNNSAYNSAIRWSDEGDSIIIDAEKFKTTCLGKENTLFKTYKLKSFVRQLHLYGFKKIDKSLYANKNFKRNHPELLKYLKRDCNKTKTRQAQESTEEELRYESCQATIKTEQQSNRIDQPRPDNAKESSQCVSTTTAVVPLQINQINQINNENPALTSLDQICSDPNTYYQLEQIELYDQQEQYTNNINYNSNYVLTMCSSEIYSDNCSLLPNRNIL